ncbi:MAG TPA: tRNA lysidine(34) synthetase TilS, partial [Rhodobacteraceae bacterium]|nr:tRNA lysidine(34) synthetase TilS [Paracoccaceae bacterium]
MITLGPLPEAPLGVPVSGGGDSVALLLLLHSAGHDLQVATVDHRLRPEAAGEALGVAKLCLELGVPHEVLVWETPEFKGNLQKAAREARRGLLAGWAKRQGLRDIVLGHTLDDQAETVLMRLARGSGVDGLAGMAGIRREGGLNWHRPMLGVRRAELRAYLREAGVGWVDDPSNDDLRYDRIKARQALEVLAPLGLSRERLAETAAHMRRARGALEVATLALAERCVEVSEAGELGLSGFENAPREVQLRLLAAGLGWVSGAGYR